MTYEPLSCPYAASYVNGVNIFVGDLGFLMRTHYFKVFCMENKRIMLYNPLGARDKGGVTPPNEGDFMDLGGFSSPPRYDTILSQRAMHEVLGTLSV